MLSCEVFKLYWMMKEVLRCNLGRLNTSKVKDQKDYISENAVELRCNQNMATIWTLLYTYTSL